MPTILLLLRRSLFAFILVTSSWLPFFDLWVSSLILTILYFFHLRLSAWNRRREMQKLQNIVIRASFEVRNFKHFTSFRLCFRSFFHYHCVCMLSLYSHSKFWASKATFQFEKLVEFSQKFLKFPIAGSLLWSNSLKLKKREFLFDPPTDMAYSG